MHIEQDYTNNRRFCDGACSREDCVSPTVLALAEISETTSLDLILRHSTRNTRQLLLTPSSPCDPQLAVPLPCAGKGGCL